MKMCKIHRMAVLLTATCASAGMPLPAFGEEAAAEVEDEERPHRASAIIVTGRSLAPKERKAPLPVQVLAGVELPTPSDPMKMLVKQISQAAREEMRTDRGTGRPYRAYHSLPIKQGQETFFYWVDIDDATRSQMVRSTRP